MKQLFAAAFAVVALFGMSQIVEANGGMFSRSRGCKSSPCASCAAPCDAPCATAAPAPVQYEDRKIKVMKPVMMEKEVDVVICKTVMTEQKYMYNISVPVTTQEKRKVYTSVPKYSEVEYVYTVMVPKTMQKTVQCTTYQVTRENVVECVPVCKTVCVTCVDECGRCYTRRERVTVMENVTRCVVKRTPVVTEQVVNYTVCEPEQRKGKKTVCEFVRTESEILVNVCNYVTQQKEGTRMVCSTVNETVKRKVSYCTMVETEQVVRVAIGGTTACSSPCSDCGTATSTSGHGHRGGLFSGGLFRRGSSCCN